MEKCGVERVVLVLLFYFIRSLFNRWDLSRKSFACLSLKPVFFPVPLLVVGGS